MEILTANHIKSSPARRIHEQVPFAVSRQHDNRWRNSSRVVHLQEVDLAAIWKPFIAEDEIGTLHRKGLFGLAQRRARDNLQRQFFEHFVHRSATLQIGRNNQNRYFILPSALLGQWFFENGAAICGQGWNHVGCSPFSESFSAALGENSDREFSSIGQYRVCPSIRPSALWVPEPLQN